MNGNRTLWETQSPLPLKSPRICLLIKTRFENDCQWNVVPEFPEFLVNTVVPERHSRKRWGTPEGEQEGENPAFRAGKGQTFPTCEPREGHRESIGAKGQ